MKRKRAQVQQKEQYDPRFPTNVINIDHRLNEKRKRVQIYPKSLSQETYLLKLNAVSNTHLTLPTKRIV